jgi:hypothetical protein
MADAMLKSGTENDRYLVPLPEKDAAPDLHGLSCRWELLKSCRGTMMSTLVHALGESYVEKNAIHRQVIDGVERIFNADTGAASLVSAANMIFRWPPRGMRRERKLFAELGIAFARLSGFMERASSSLRWKGSASPPASTTPPLTASNCAPIRTSGGSTTPYA